MNFTPGPWTWDKEEGAIVAGTPEKGKIIAHPEVYTRKESEANINLITAAPDMYAALKESRDLQLIVLDTFALDAATGQSLVDLINNTRQALAKAEGRK